MKSKTNNIIVITILIALVLLIAYFVGTGFVKRGDVVLSDYSVLDDGTKIIFKTSIPTSVGYIRCYKNNGGGYELVLQKNAGTGKWEKPNFNGNISAEE